MNKNGQVFFYTLMLGIVIIVLGIAFAYPVKQFVDTSMSDLTCTAPSSDWIQAECWFLDFLKPLTIGGIIFVGIAIIAAKKYVESK